MLSEDSLAPPSATYRGALHKDLELRSACQAVSAQLGPLPAGLSRAATLDLQCPCATLLLESQSSALIPLQAAGQIQMHKSLEHHLA